MKSKQLLLQDSSCYFLQMKNTDRYRRWPKKVSVHGVRIKSVKNVPMKLGRDFFSQIWA